ncbi:MAG: hypothetical protein IPM35_08195 [Myxococcales bacterium]|nr:hypothetical protein [Myxococcales bacterium]
MAQPKLPAELVPEALKALVEQLASLPEEQREAVIHAARRERLHSLSARFPGITCLPPSAR